ncbi:hypothetical protein B0J17DRAFT_257383 [Rhizoctonia solani]|nr:hypothetical protein B0J17DRAFT_257383 [Rhizoctonia solani]
MTSKHLSGDPTTVESYLPCLLDMESEDQSYKLANIAGYTSRHYGPSEDWAGSLHKWLPPEFKPRIRRKGALSTPAHFPAYNGRIRDRDAPKHDTLPSQSASCRSNQISVHTSTFNPTKPSWDSHKAKLQGLDSGSGSSIPYYPQTKQNQPATSRNPPQMGAVIEDMNSLAIVFGLSSSRPANAPTVAPLKPYESNQTRDTLSQNMQRGEPAIWEPSTSNMQRMVESIINDMRNLDVASRPSSARSASAPTNRRAQPVERAKQPNPTTAKPRGQNGLSFRSRVQSSY